MDIAEFRRNNPLAKHIRCFKQPSFESPRKRLLDGEPKGPTELRRLESLRKQMRENAEKAEEVVRLNVRGKVFQTHKSHLLRLEGNYFYCMLASDIWKPGKDGSYFIDRPYEAFERIIQYLSDGELSFEGLNQYEARMLRDNLDFFQIQLD